MKKNLRDCAGRDLVIIKRHGNYKSLKLYSVQSPNYSNALHIEIDLPKTFSTKKNNNNNN